MIKMPRFTFGFDPGKAKELDIGINKLDEFAYDGSLQNELWPDITQDIAQGEMDIFDRENAVTGFGRWTELSEDYRLRKEKLYPGKPILEATGRLRTAATVPGSPDNIIEYGRLGMTYGINKSAIKYARAHQYGYPPRNLPMREYLHLNIETAERIYHKIRLFILDKVGRTVGGKGYFKTRSAVQLELNKMGAARDRGLTQTGPTTFKFTGFQPANITNIGRL